MDIDKGDRVVADMHLSHTMHIMVYMYIHPHWDDSANCENSDTDDFLLLKYKNINDADKLFQEIPCIVNLACSIPDEKKDKLTDQNLEHVDI